MEAPARFPVTEDDFAHWAVYADWLLTRGDPRGDLIAMELALPADPEPEALEAFQALAAALRAPFAQLSAAWCLGHVRMLRIAPALRTAGTHATESGTFPEALKLLGTDHASRLEAVTIPLGRYEHGPAWEQLFAAIPPSCARVDLQLDAWQDDDLDALMDALPATVRELGVRRLIPSDGRPPIPERLISDRFDVVELGRFRTGPVLARQLAAALARTRSVRLRVSWLDDGALPRDRWELGQPEDAALIQPARRRAVRLERESPLLTQRGGVTPSVRMQLARAWTETHRVRQFGDLFQRTGIEHLECRGGAWTITANADGMQRNDEPIAPHATVPIADGDRFGTGPDTWCFVERGATAHLHELLYT